MWRVLPVDSKDSFWNGLGPLRSDVNRIRTLYWSMHRLPRSQPEGLNDRSGRLFEYTRVYISLKTTVAGCPFYSV